MTRTMRAVEDGGARGDSRGGEEWRGHAIP
jgi:hypothetical protein